MHKILLSLLCIFTLNFITFAQKQVQYVPSLLHANVMKTDKGYATPAVDVAAELEQDEYKRTVLMDKKLYFGKEFEVSIDFFKESEKSQLANGEWLYQYKISCPNAVSVNLIFDQFELAEGVRLFVVDPINHKYDGAYTSLNNNASKMLGTDIIYARDVYIEAVVPADKDLLSSLNLGTIVSGYRHFDNMMKALNSSGGCEIDVNCPLGDGWESQRNSVALIIMGGGTCTGSLVNNTSGTIIPYFLSAEHCGTSTGGWVFRFRWESPEGQADCGTAAPSVDGPQNMTINGATLRAFNEDSDFVLAELNTAPNPAWDVYYAGWDRSGIPGTQLTCIHHPAGDVKKITRDNSPAIESTWSGTPSNSHWRAPSWDEGVTEGGSSGSPLYDQNHRVIGQLHGGASYCGAAPNNLWDDYGKFSVSWVGSGTDASRLSNWLDPSGADPLFIDGLNPAVLADAYDASLSYVSGASNNICGADVAPVLTIGNSGTTALTTITIQYGFDGINTLEYEWTGTLNQYETVTVTLPNAVMSEDQHTFEAAILTVNGQADENDLNDEVSSSFNTILSGEIERLYLILDCYGSEITWNVQDESTAVVYNGGPYENAMANDTVIVDMCLANECHVFTMNDSYGDGIAGCVAGAGENGSYTISRPSGFVVAEMLQEDAGFGTLHTNEFCYDNMGISTKSLNENLQLYPNPTATVLNIELTNTTIQRIEVKTITGQTLLQKEINQTMTTLQVDTYSKGVYFLTVNSENGSHTEQFIVK